MEMNTLGKTPISDDQPTGSDVRYDPEFEKLQAEIDKLSSPSADSQVDWVFVEKASIRILGEKSKDLTVACYLAVALVCNRKIEGVDDSLAILKDLLETYWDKLYPPKKRMRGRMGAIEWWLERTQTELQKRQPAPVPAEMLERIKGNLKGIDGVLSEKMPDAPLLRPLERIIDGFPVEKGDTAQAEAESATAGAGPAPRRSDAPQENRGTSAAQDAAMPGASAGTGGTEESISGAITSAAEARKGADAGFQRLRQVSLFLLQNDMKNPLAYRYRRIASWGKLTALPPNTDGTTQIQAPAPQVLSSLETLLAEGNLEALVQNAEQKVSQFIFWFDLNRWVAEALNDLGAGYQNASLAVCQETALLLDRLPGLETLQFADGTAFADPQTLQWLQGLKSSASRGGKKRSGTSKAAAGPDAGFSETVNEARALARKKKLIEAVELLQAEMRQSASQRQHMQWRLAIARLLMEMKKTKLCLPHLEQIIEDIDRFSLEIWEPELALEGLTTAWQAFGSQTDTEYKSRATTLLERIAKVDPVAALRVAQ